MRMLVFGRTGQVATELRRLGSEKLAVTALGRAQADLRDARACAEIVRACRADVVVNAAAFTAVDEAEQKSRTVMQVNAEAPGAIATACAKRGLPFVHLSTDYVFDGAGARPLREDDPARPLNVYGRSKRTGEEAVVAAGGTSAILRASWVFSADGNNFVRTMLRLGAVCNRLSVVADQHGCPTAAADIAAAVAVLARNLVEGGGETGVFHYCGAPATTWFGFARRIFANLPAARRPSLLAIPTSGWPARAERPLSTVLDCTRIRACHGIAQPDWRAALARVQAELAEEVA